MTINGSPAKYPQPPYPIHESVKDKLDPEYVEFYNKYIINNQQVHYQPVKASRSSGTLIPGGGPPKPVGKTEDIAIKRTETEGPDVMVRCFTPLGDKPADGWPAMVYYHGGESKVPQSLENEPIANLDQAAGSLETSTQRTTSAHTCVHEQASWS